MKKLISIFCWVGLLAGCLPEADHVVSLHPFYTDQTLINDHSLIGKWCLVDGSKTSYVWRIKRQSEGEYDVLILSRYRFNGHLFALQGAEFLDMEPNHNHFPSGPHRGLVEGYYLPVHCLTKLERNGDDLILRNFNSGANSLIQDSSLSGIAYTKMGGKIVLTDSSERIQSFLTTLDFQTIFDEGMRLVRLQPQFEDNEVIFDPALLGTWSTFDVQEKDGRFYDIVDDDGIQYYGKLICRNGTRLMAMYGDESDLQPDPENQFHLIPDFFCRIIQNEGNVKFEEISFDEAEKILNPTSSTEDEQQE